MSENIYSWEFDDNKNRSSMWYTIALSIVLWLSIWWFFTKQYWLSFIILLIAWLYYFVQNNSEDNIKVKITNLWILIDWSFYDFKSIDSFWIVYKWDIPTLLRLHLNKKWIRSIDVQITSNIVNNLQEILNNYIDETPKIEFTFTEKMITLLKL